MRLSPILLLTCVTVTCAIAQTPAVADGGVLNAASFAKGQAVSAGQLVSIFGSDLAASLAQADSVPLSSKGLNGVTVMFNRVPAPLLFVSPGQINAQLPWGVMPAGVTSGTADVVVMRGQTQSSAQMVQIRASAPGVFSIPPGVGNAIAINADSSIAAPAGSITGFTTHPAKVGDTLIVLATGLGAVDSPIADGAASSDKLRNTVVKPVVTIGGQPAQVAFSGLTPQFPGVYQLNVVVPSVTAGDKLPIQIQMDGVMTTDQVTIAVTQ
jgi:uncharacterized protein (TIGR03437 family)